MVRGRKPKPLELRVADGNPGKRPLPEPDPSTDPLGYPPRGMVASQKKIWKEVSKQCSWLRSADRKAMELLCRAWVQMETTGVRITNLVVSQKPFTEDDIKLLTVLERTHSRARDFCLRMLAELGATATTRARVVHPKPKEDPAERYFA